MFGQVRLIPIMLGYVMPPLHVENYTVIIFRRRSSTTIFGTEKHTRAPHDRRVKIIANSTRAGIHDDQGRGHRTRRQFYCAANTDTTAIFPHLKVGSPFLLATEDVARILPGPPPVAAVTAAASTAAAATAPTPAI